LNLAGRWFFSVITEEKNMIQMNIVNFCLCLCCVVLVSCGRDKAENPTTSSITAQQKMAMEQQQNEVSQKALALIEKKIKNNPKNAINYQSKAAILQSLGRESEALGALEQFVELHPVAEAYVGLGLRLDKRGHTEKATDNYRKGLRAYNQRIKKGPPNSHTKAQRAFVLFLLDKNSEAKAIVEKILKVEPNDREAENLKEVFDTYPNRAAFIKGG
jgi:tetratricopeptide (TPR) repeat protein